MLNSTTARLVALGLGTPLSLGAREKALFLYSRAIARGDWPLVEALIQLAASDAPLADMIWDWEMAEASAERAELCVASLPERARQAKARQAKARQAKARQAKAPIAAPAPAPPPDALTVADVAARLQADSAQPEAAASGAATPSADALSADCPALEMLRRRFEPLPAKLNRRWLRETLAGANETSAHFQELFLETARLLNLGRGQNAAHLAAARRAGLSARAHTPERRSQPVAPTRSDGSATRKTFFDG